MEALVLFADFMYKLFVHGIHTVFHIDDLKVLAELLIGGLIPYLFGSYLVQLVGYVAGKVVDKIRRHYYLYDYW